jgi:hypothetical protein
MTPTVSITSAKRIDLPARQSQRRRNIGRSWRLTQSTRSLGHVLLRWRDSGAPSALAIKHRSLRVVAFTAARPVIPYSAVDAGSAG